MSPDKEAFIKLFVQDLLDGNVAIFAGAGMSAGVGYVNWIELLREIADELELDIDTESRDLISIAQFHVNELGGRAKINKKILNEFTEEATQTENHEILARLPVSTYWTTNYDSLIEDALESANKRADVKHEVDQLADTRQRRHAVVYKMHGDAKHPAKATITKQDYQSYYKENEAFITALSGDLVFRTFLFIGFSFADPNLEYVLGRLNIQFGQNARNHYWFVKELQRSDYGRGEKQQKKFEYDSRRQDLVISDLQKRYKIQPIRIKDYSEITEILAEIERRFKKKTIFISGSAANYGVLTEPRGQGLVHKISAAIIKDRSNIVSGFGVGVGSAVINGALEEIHKNPRKLSDDQLILYPFPQFATGGKEIGVLWQEYRERIIGRCGIAIFVFGNKRNDVDEIVDADGVLKEFAIALEQGVIPVPVGFTGFASKRIADMIICNPAKYLGENAWMLKLIKKLNGKQSDTEIVQTVMEILKQIQE